MLNNINIKIGAETAPFLLMWNNLEIINSEVEKFANNLADKYEVPKSYIHILRDNWEKIKVAEIKSFLEQSHFKSPYKFQVFIIENISRMTLTTANSCLKFFEEPKKWNIIFLTNSSESGILDTILSRTQNIYLAWTKQDKKDDFYYDLIDNYLKNNNPEIFSYFYRVKVEKEDYIKFLENIVIYAKKNLVFLDLLEELHDDINKISTNNLLAKYIVDKYLLKIK